VFGPFSDLLNFGLLLQKYHKILVVFLAYHPQYIVYSAAGFFRLFREKLRKKEKKTQEKGAKRRYIIQSK